MLWKEETLYILNLKISLEQKIKKEVLNRNHKNILHPSDRKTLHGYASGKRHFLHHGRRKDAGRRTGGEP